MNNSISKQKKYYRNLLIGALIIFMTAVLGGRRLREDMIQNVAEQMGERVADLYDNAQEQLISNVGILLVNSEAEMDYLLDSDNAEDISAYLRMAGDVITTQCQYNQIEMFSFRNGHLIYEDYGEYDLTDPDMTERLQEAIACTGRIYFSDLYTASIDGEDYITVAYANPKTANVIGYHVAAADFMHTNANEKMLDGAGFALMDSEWNAVAHVSHQETPIDDTELTESIFPKLIELYRTSGKNSHTTITYGKTRYYIYFTDLSTGWHTILAFPESALTADLKINWVLYYIGVFSLLAALIAFGVYKRKQENLAVENRVLSKFTDNFKASYFINLIHHTYDIIKEPSDETISSANQLKDMWSLWKAFLEQDVIPEDREKLNEMFAMSKIQERLKGHSSLSCEFKHNRYGWCRLSCIPVDYTKDGLVENAVFFLVIIDHEKQIQLNLEKENKNLDDIVKAASMMFDRFFVVNTETETYEYSYIKKSIANSEAVKHATMEAFQSRNINRFVNPNTNEPITKPFTMEGLQELLKDQDDYYFEYKDNMSSGKYLGATVYCMERNNGIPSRIIYAMRDITDVKLGELEYRKQLKEANERLADVANHDPLTGLYNRRGFEEILKMNLITAPKVALLIIDVDRFKSVNDTFGHFNGDKLLVKVATLLKESFRNNDILVRLGGDEFMAILLNCDISQADFIPGKIDRINEKLANPSDDTPQGSISVGVAFSRTNETNQLYQRADDALYHVKENGRKGCCIYEKMFETNQD